MTKIFHLSFLIFLLWVIRNGTKYYPGWRFLYGIPYEFFWCLGELACSLFIYIPKIIWNFVGSMLEQFRVYRVISKYQGMEALKAFLDKQKDEAKIVNTIEGLDDILRD
jgi:hypothetical protein